MIVTPDVGAICLLEARLNNSWPASKDLTIKLYTNNIFPADTNTTGEFTEATGGGYAAKTLSCGGWAVTSVGGIAQADYGEQVWTFTGPLTTNLTIYGYYVIDDDGVLQWAERLAIPAKPVLDGQHLNITPIYKASKGTVS